MFGPAWLAYGHSFTVENDGQAMAAYFKASQLMACFKEFGSVSDARFLQMGRRLSRGWRSPCLPGRAESGPTALETWASFPSTVPGVTTLPPPSCWSR